MKLHFHGLSPLAGCLFGLFVGAALVAMLTLPVIKAMQTRHQQHYGQALAGMAASQAIDASFNHDLVRLQVILQDIMENPDTQLATIHDVENKLLVQAGDSRSTIDANASFTAPIVLQDSIAGYVTVSLTTEDDYPVNRWIILALLLVTAVLLLAELYRQGSFALEFNKKQQRPSASDNEEAVDAQQEAEDLPSVFSIIHIKNLAVLEQQLSGDNLRKTLNQVEQNIADVLALYNGMSYQRQGDQFRLSFLANDATNEALFRAACSAWLIVELSSIVNNIPLDLAAFVSANEEDLIPANLPIAGLVLETQAASDTLICRRLKFVELGSEDGRKVVAGFEQPFQSLLEKQRTQLAQLERN